MLGRLSCSAVTPLPLFIAPTKNLCYAMLMKGLLRLDR
jgi:hypothetical protein